MKLNWSNKDEGPIPWFLQCQLDPTSQKYNYFQLLKSWIPRRQAYLHYAEIFLQPLSRFIRRMAYGLHGGSQQCSFHSCATPHNGSFYRLDIIKAAKEKLDKAQVFFFCRWSVPFTIFGCSEAFMEVGRTGIDTNPGWRAGPWLLQPQAK